MCETYLHHGLNLIELPPWSVTTPHFNHYATQTPDIDFTGITPISVRIMHHLWRHPEYRSFHVGSLANTVVGVRRLFRDTEIGDLAGSVQVDEDIVAFEISVPNVFLV